jgi:hypothetical protein
VFFEQHLSRGDYRRPDAAQTDTLRTASDNGLVEVNR